MGWGPGWREPVGEGRAGRGTDNCFWVEFSRRGYSQRTNVLSELRTVIVSDLY